MLAAVIRASLHHPWIVVCAAVVLLIGGGIVLARAKYDVFPEFVPAQADIQVEAPGLTPSDVELLVTQPLENAINGGANIKSVRSESIQGLSAIRVVFTEGTDVFRDRQLLEERIAEAASSLPAGVHSPALGPMTSSTMDLLKVGFTSDRLTPMELRTLVDYTIRPQILAVPGVARAIVYGGERREIQIRLSPTRMAALRVSMNDAVAAAAGATSRRGAGFIDTSNQRVLIATTNAARTPDEIGRTVVTQHEGRNVLLGDIAKVVYAPEPAFGDARVQGKPDVLVSISSQYGANTLEVTHALEAQLATLVPLLKERGVEMTPPLHRPANFIEVALRNMRNSLLLGAALVVAVLLAFLRNWRTGVISFVTIPLSLLAAIMVMDRFGWTINTMTLGGLAVAVGIVVDDAIIDVENIVRRLRLAARRGSVQGLDTVVWAASMEVRRPIVVATFAVGAVFTPILFLHGLQGSFFAPLAAAFLLATFASLLVALTVTPALAFLLLRDHLAHIDEPRWVRKLKVVHHRLLRRFMPHAPALLAASIVIGLLAVWFAQRFGGELLPPFREGHFVAQVTGPTGSSLSEMTRLGERIARRMLAVHGVQTVSQQVGRAESGEDTWPPNRCEFHVELAPDLPARDQIRIESELRAVLGEFPGIESELVTFLGDRISESISGETAELAIKIFGSDLTMLDTAAQDIANVLRKLPDAIDVRAAATADVPTIRIRPRLDRLAMFGLRPLDVMDAVATAFQGERVAQVYEGNQPIGVRVILQPSSRRDPEAVAGLLLRTAHNRLVRLGDIADVSLSSSRESIAHDSGQRRQLVTLNTSSNDVIGFTDRVRAAIAKQVKLPPGVFIDIGGEAQGAKAATEDLLMQGSLAAFAVLALLLFAFPDWRSVAMIVANVPFALLGGVLAVYFSGASISIGALVGFVALFGISARNTIMLIAHYRHLVADEQVSWSRFTALRGARERLTPILMTALVTAMGLLPLALGSGEAGREVEGPMAIVILGGLISSTLLNLLVMPALANRFVRFVPARVKQTVEAS